MNYEGFFTWLNTERNMSERSAKDTVSRLKRVLRIVGEDSVSNTTVKTLNDADEFAALSMFIKSQLRRSVTLYQEFEK